MATNMAIDVDNFDDMACTNDVDDDAICDMAGTDDVDDDVDNDVAADVAYGFLGYIAHLLIGPI